MRALQRGAIVVALPLAMAAAGVASRIGASRSQIAIHEQGMYINNPTPATPTLGKYTIELAGATFGPAGATNITYDPSNPTYDKGEQQSSLIGADTLRNTNGTLELAFKGIHIQVNGKLTPSGQVVAPFVEYGTWTIRTATGIYAGWKGGGKWTSVAYGYRYAEPYSVEWDGYITR